MVTKEVKKWENYEQVAQDILNEMAEQFGLDRVEGKQDVLGYRSGTTYEIDAKGIAIGQEGFVVIECRRYTTSKLNQEDLSALAYGIINTRAKGGIVVSPLGLQEGAEKIARAENIVSVILDENSTNTNYLLKFLNKVFKNIKEEISVSDHIEFIPPLKADQSAGFKLRSN